MTNPTDIIEVVPGAEYRLPTYFVTKEGLHDGVGVNIKFCKGNKADPTAFRQEGIISESLVELAARHLEDVNVGDLKDECTTEAIAYLRSALAELQARQAKRRAAGVQGTYKPASELPLARPFIYIINNSIPEPGTTTVKLLGASINRGKDNFGNPPGITLFYGDPNFFYGLIIEGRKYKANRIRLEVEGAECPDQVVYNRYEFFRLANWQTIKVDISGNAGEIQMDSEFDQNIELLIPTTNGTKTTVYIYPTAIEATKR